MLVPQPMPSPAIQLSTTFTGTSLVLCLFLPSPAVVGELSLAQVDCFSGCTHNGLDLFAHILIPQTLKSDFGSSDQSSDAGLFLCFP